MMISEIVTEGASELFMGLAITTARFVKSGLIDSTLIPGLISRFLIPFGSGLIPFFNVSDRSDCMHGSDCEYDLLTGTKAS